MSPLRPLWSLGATYYVHLRLIEKLVGDFLLVIIELFFARCFRFVTIRAFDRQTDGQNFDSKVRSNEVRCAQKPCMCVCVCLDGCEVAAPAEGGEACRYVDLGRSEADYSASRLSGTWFLIAVTTRFPDVVVSDAVTSVQVDNHTANFTFSFFDK